MINESINPGVGSCGVRKMYINNMVIVSKQRVAEKNIRVFYAGGRRYLVAKIRKIYILFKNLTKENKMSHIKFSIKFDKYQLRIEYR